MLSRILALSFAVWFAAGCAKSATVIPGTEVPQSQDNEAIIDRIEKYRIAVENRDASALLLMASKRYWEDAGTPSGADDYGYKGLQEILGGRFQEVDGIRYSMKYMSVDRKGDRAFVDVLVDASYTMRSALGDDVRHDLQDKNQFVLEWNGKDWLFLSGM